jgi:hypothetical protein
MAKLCLDEDDLGRHDLSLVSCCFCCLNQSNLRANRLRATAFLIN